MPLLVTMTIAGSIPLLICSLLWAIQKENFSISLGLLLLKVSIFFYLVPMQLLYHILPGSFTDFFEFGDKETALNKPIRIYYQNEFVIPYQGQFLWIPRWLVVLFSLWIICIVIAIYIQVKKYRQVKDDLRAHSIQSNLNKSNTKIKILNSPYLSTPCSIGFLKPCIVFPDNLEDSDYQEELFRHELCHIKNKDIWIRMLCLLIICFHFYNPLSYLLFFMYHILSECACDMYAISGLPTKKKKQYAQLLVELAENKNPFHSVLQNNFSSSKYFLKKRISFIMKKKPSKHTSRIIVCISTILSIFLCSTTIFAYKAPKSINWNPKNEIAQNCFMEFVPTGYVNELSQPLYLDFSKSDIVFLTDSGEEIPVFKDNIHLQKSCSHTFKTGTTYYHKIEDTGGCTMISYKSTRCTKCGYEKGRTYLGSYEFPICPH